MQNDENTLEYLQRPIPGSDSLNGLYTTDLGAGRGLSREKLIDSRYFEDCLNIDVGKLPVIRPMKVFAPVDNLRPIWSSNEAAAGPNVDKETLRDINLHPERHAITGQSLMRGSYPSIAAFGRWLVVGMYCEANSDPMKDPDEDTDSGPAPGLMSGKAWDSWNDYATDSWEKESGDTRIWGVRFINNVIGSGSPMGLECGGAQVFVNSENSNEDSVIARGRQLFTRWYCLFFIDTEESEINGTSARNAYVALPPVSGNDCYLEKTANRGRSHSDSKIITPLEVVRMYDYLATAPVDIDKSSEVHGRKRLSVFQLYSQDEDWDLGDYETVILASSTEYYPESYSQTKKNLMGYDKNNRYGVAFNGYSSGFDLSSTPRCVLTPFVGGFNKIEDAYVDIAELSQLYHMTSTPFKGDNPESASCRGILSRVCNPFGYWAPPYSSANWNTGWSENYKDENGKYIDKQINPDVIEKVESITRFVPGAVPAIAAVTANSRLYALWKSGVYVSGFNNYADFAMKFGDYAQDSDAWSSLSAGNADTVGDFIAAAPYGNRVVCFKDNCTMEVRGTSSPFTLVTTGDVGAVSADAVCSGSGYLLYAGRDNVYMYTGSEPQSVADVLCLKELRGAALCARDGYVYASLTDENGEVLDCVMSMDTGYWGRLSLPESCIQMVNAKNGVYALAGEGEDHGLYMLGRHWPDYWSFETKYISGGTYETLKLDSLNMIFDLAAGSWLKISVRYYEGDEYREIWKLKAARRVEKRKLKYRFNGHQCEGFQVKVEGGGFGCIYTLEMAQKAVKRS